MASANPRKPYFFRVLEPTADKLDALAGLRPRLLADLEKLPGARIIDGRFTSVQQAIGTPRKNAVGAAFRRDFVEEAKASGLVARLIERYKVRCVYRKFKF